MPSSRETVPEEIEQELVLKLAKARQRQGLTYADVAARAGLHYTAISLIERGKRHMTLLVFLKICTALGLQPAALFEDTTGAFPTTATDTLPQNLADRTATKALHEALQKLHKDK